MAPALTDSSNLAAAGIADILRVAFPGRDGLSMAAAQEELHAKKIKPFKVPGPPAKPDLHDACSEEQVGGDRHEVVASPAGASWARAKLLGGQHLANQVDWAALADGRERRTTLRLRGLPKSLWSVQSLQRTLAQNGLLEAIDFIRILPGSGGKLGSTVLNVTSPDRVPSVVKFFHGRQFGLSPPVAVSFFSVQGLDALRETYSETPSLAATKKTSA